MTPMTALLTRAQRKRPRPGALGLLLCAGLLAAPVSAPAGDEVSPQIAAYRDLYAQTGNHAVLWLIADAHAQAADHERTHEALTRLAELRMGFYPPAGSALAGLEGDPRFAAVLNRMRDELPQVRRGRPVFVLNEPGLVSEGVAFDPARNRLFVGDMNNRVVWAVDPDGRTRRFASDPDLRPIGMAVDPSGDRLWVAATNAFWRADGRRAALLALDLESGRLASSHTAAEAVSFNDLAIAPNGDVYVTDSLGGAVFRLDRASGEMARVTPLGAMGFPNGIAITDDGRAVFVAQGATLRRIDTATGAMTPVGQPDDLFTMGIDGMYWRGGALYAVQAGATPGRVIRMDLDGDGSAVTGFEILEAGNPVFDWPTTGVIVGDRMFVLANSQIKRMDDDGVVREPETLDPVVVLEIPIGSER